jgi:hypothetical protein
MTSHLHGTTHEPTGPYRPVEVTAYDITGTDRQGRIDLSKITTYDVPAKNDRRVRPCHVPRGSMPHAR